jgi:hypothetical protein
MMQRKMKNNVKTVRRGIALVVTLVFIMVFMAMSIGMMTMSSNNAIAASNLKNGNLARSTAESGIELLRYWINEVTIPSSMTKDQLFAHTVNELKSALDDRSIPAEFDEAGSLWIGPVTINTADNRIFSAVLSLGETQGIDIRITGTNGQLSRTLVSAFTYGLYSEEGKYLGFDFGVATKGPLSLGNLLLDGKTFSVEADVYIESMNTNNALDINNAQIAGDVKIVNPSGFAAMSGGQSSIGGEKGADAIANHVEVGVDPADFPIANPTHFEQYVNGITINSGNVSSYNNNATLENVRIAAGTNPKFTGNTVIKGVMYIESPNVVEFGGNATITGVIVGDGDMTDNSKTNQVNFTGTVNSQSVTQLPADTKFDGLRNETGTFLMAPGFSVEFGGNFGVLNGCIVANGVRTYGNAGGEIGGSIINYSTEPMDLKGSDIVFNKSGITDVPSGFILKSTNFWTINYTPSSYTEVVCGF